MADAKDKQMDESVKQKEFTALYKRLDVNKTATRKEIENAYEEKMKKYPKFVPLNEEEMKDAELLLQAYEVLTDPVRKDVYDNQGIILEAPPPSKVAGQFMTTFLGKKKRAIRTKDVFHPLKLTLEEIYTGTSRRIGVTRDRLYHDPLHDKQKKHKEKTVLECFIRPGTPEGKKYKFEAESDQDFGQQAGDVIFEVKEVKHSLFKRQGADLLYTKWITIEESLSGFDFNLQTVSGKVIRIKSETEDVLAHDEIMTVEGHGMPLYSEQKLTSFTVSEDVDEEPLYYGNLFILFKVKFPETIELNEVEMIKKQLRDLDGMVTMSFEEMNQDLECQSLVRYNAEQKNTNPEGGHELWEEFNDYDFADKLKERCNLQ